MHHSNYRSSARKNDFARLAVGNSFKSLNKDYEVFFHFTASILPQVTHVIYPFPQSFKCPLLKKMRGSVKQISVGDQHHFFTFIIFLPSENKYIFRFSVDRTSTLSSLSSSKGNFTGLDTIASASVSRSLSGHCTIQASGGKNHALFCSAAFQCPQNISTCMHQQDIQQMVYNEKWLENV